MPFFRPYRGNKRRRAGFSAIGNRAGQSFRPQTTPSGTGNADIGQWQTAAQVGFDFNAPQFQRFEDQAAYAQDQAGWRNQGYDIQQQDYQNQYATGNAQIDLDYAGNAVDQAAARRQMGYYDDMYGIDQNRYNSAMAYQSGNQVFADGRYALAGRDVALDDQTYGIAGERYGLQGQTHTSVLAQIANQAAMAQREAFEGNRDAGSQATGAGAYTSAGHGWDREDIASALGFRITDLGEQTKQEQVNRQQQGLDYDEAGIRNQRDHIDYERQAIDYMSTTSDIANNKNNLTYDLAEAGLNKAEQQARLQDRLATLDIQAQRFGVNRQELQNKLQTALRNLGLDRQISMGQLTDMLSSNNANYSQLVMSILQQAGMQGTNDAQVRPSSSRRPIPSMW